ncbi:MAG: hypothetical protein HYX69_04480 [Planctomycetia bacterium]|nr:hypothetical protein [Planctomycetia bacterium]
MADKLHRIQSIGFTRAGCWKLSGSGLAFEFDVYAGARNVFYAFVVAGELMYVGRQLSP